MFPFVCKELDLMGFAYVLSMGSLELGSHGFCSAITISGVCKVWNGTIISYIGMSQDMAVGVVCLGAPDLVAFRCPCMLNLNFCQKFPTTGL